jgi:hypothetical protein
LASVWHLGVKSLCVFNSGACQAQTDAKSQPIKLASVCSRELAPIAPIDHSMARFFLGRFNTCTQKFTQQWCF